MVSTAVTSRPPVTRYLPGGSGKVGCSMIKPCSSSHQSVPSNFQRAGATPASFNRVKLFSWTPRGPGSRGHRPHDCAPLPEVAPGSPNAAMYCVEMRWTFVLSRPDAWAWLLFRVSEESTNEPSRNRHTMNRHEVERVAD